MGRTLVIIKPDGVQRGLIGEIISRFEKRGLKLTAAKFIKITREFAERQYAIHKGKPFFEGLVNYMISTPVLAMIWEGEKAIEAVRQTIGATNPLESLPGTIRHDLSLLTSRNLVHASDSEKTADEEITLWFKESEIFSWDQSDIIWIFGKN